MKKLYVTACAGLMLALGACGGSDASKEDTINAREALENPEEIIDEQVVVESENTPRQAADSAVNDLKDAANETGDAIEGTAETLKEKSAAKVNEFKEKAGGIINEGTKKAQEAIGNAGSALENAVN